MGNVSFQPAIDENLGARGGKDDGDLIRPSLGEADVVKNF
jgi:hypothetical protein